MQVLLALGKAHLRQPSCLSLMESGSKISRQKTIQKVPLAQTLLTTGFIPDSNHFHPPSEQPVAGDFGVCCPDFSASPRIAFRSSDLPAITVIDSSAAFTKGKGETTTSLGLSARTAPASIHQQIEEQITNFQESLKKVLKF
jgi:hypothetical protein